MLHLCRSLSLLLVVVAAGCGESGGSSNDETTPDPAAPQPVTWAEFCDAEFSREAGCEANGVMPSDVGNCNAEESCWPMVYQEDFLTWFTGCSADRACDDNAADCYEAAAEATPWTPATEALRDACQARAGECPDLNPSYCSTISRAYVDAVATKQAQCFESAADCLAALGCGVEGFEPLYACTN